MNHRSAGSVNKQPNTPNELQPVDKRVEDKRASDGLPWDQKELTLESTQFADLCQHFSAQNIDIPPEVLDRLFGLRKLAIPHRIRVLGELNRELMEYLSAVGKGTGIRQ